MILPLGTNRPLRRATVVNHALIVANLAVFLVTLVVSGPSVPHADGSGGASAPTEEIIARFGLFWSPHEPWRFFTYAFLHAGWMHVLGNMLVLWVFGPNVEDRLGRVGYLALYLAGAVGAGLAHVATTTLPVIGASGAVAAVTGAYLVLFPRTEIRTFIFFIYVGVYNIPATWFLGFAIFRDFFGGMMHMDDGIARTAHLGGYAVGAGVSFLLLATGVLKREMFDMFAIVQRGRRLRDIRGAAASFNSRMRPGVQTEVPTPDELGGLRAQIASRLVREDPAAAAGLYRELLSRSSASPRAAVLSKHNQLAVANFFFTSGDHRAAFEAYRLFVENYPRDPQTPHTRLMLGLLAARYLGDATAARGYIQAALPSLTDAEDGELARSLLSELPTERAL